MRVEAAHERGPGIASPFSTGGGGTHFEQLVGACYLVALLAAEVPWGAQGITRAVAFQNRWRGAALDDLLITSDTGQETCQLALEVKHALPFSAANHTFRQVVANCWQTYTGGYGWDFEPQHDRLGIAIGVWNANVPHVQTTLEWARASTSADEFLAKVSSPGLSSKGKQKCVGAFREALKAADPAATDDDLWRLLRCLVVLHFDLEGEGSRDSALYWNRLLDLIQPRELAVARALFDRLTSIGAELGQVAGQVSRADLLGRLPGFQLVDAPDCTDDLRRLREHTRHALGDIRVDIAGKVRLPRDKLVSQSLEAIRSASVVALVGEPGTGKSGLLRLLADRLGSEGEVLATSADRLPGTTIESFESTLGLRNSFQTLLSACASAPLRCLLVDGADRVMDAEDRRRVLGDIARALWQHNQRVQEVGLSDESCWTLVFACRRAGLGPIMESVSGLREQGASMRIVEVEGLSATELDVVACELPELSHVLRDPRLAPLLCRPLMLDIVALPAFGTDAAAVTSLVTESQVMERFWHCIVRRSEGGRPGRGEPAAREALSLKVAEAALEGRDLSLVEGPDADALRGLVADRVLVERHGAIQFAHDVFQDWGLVRLLLAQRGRLTELLGSHAPSLRLVRPLELYAAWLLEVREDADAWEELLADLDGAPAPGPRWPQAAIDGILSSPVLSEIVPVLKEPLAADEGSLLMRFLRALRARHGVVPSDFLALFADLPAAMVSELMAHTRRPHVQRWAPVLGFAIDHASALSQGALAELVYVLADWLRWTPEDAPWRLQAGRLALRLLSASDSGSAPLVAHPDLKKQLTQAVLHAADCMPDDVEAFVRWGVASNDSELADALLQPVGTSLYKHLPAVLAEATTKLLCVQPDGREPDAFFGERCGIRTDVGDFFPPTFWKGPFMVLLIHHPDVGLDLILQLTEHATCCWRNAVAEGVPVPQRIALESGVREVWGDPSVYCWSEWGSNGPAPVICALMALEE